jgi:MSHA biogenesis protein MshP
MYKQCGASAMIVVVLIVLFALLGTYMSTMSTLGSLTTTQSGSAMQAWFAARTGVEWAVQRSLEASEGGCTCAANCCAGINAQILNFSEGGLNGYSANITCSAGGVTESTISYCVYDLSVTASNNSSAQMTSVSRTISLSISDRNAP